MTDTLSTLKQILDLEQQREKKEKDKTRIESSEFPSKPKSPIKRDYPPVKAKIRWPYILNPAIVCFVIDIVVFYLGMIIAAIKFMLGFLIMCLIIPVTVIPIVWIGYYFMELRKKHKEKDEEKIRNSDEYKAQCAAIDMKYENERRVYDTETLPQYEQAYAAWEQENNAKLQEVIEDLKQIEAELKPLYQSIENVPDKYHNVVAIEYMCYLIEYKDFNIERAVNAYTCELEQRRREEQARRAEEEWYRQEEAARRAEERREFARTAAAAAAGSYFGTRQANRRQGKSRNSSSSSSSRQNAFCPFSCPKKKNDPKFNHNSYGEHRCPLDPRTCGYGYKY